MVNFKHWDQDTRDKKNKKQSTIYLELPQGTTDTRPAETAAIV